MKMLIKNVYEVLNIKFANNRRIIRKMTYFFVFNLQYFE